MGQNINLAQDVSQRGDVMERAKITLSGRFRAFNQRAAGEGTYLGK